MILSALLLGKRYPWVFLLGWDLRELFLLAYRYTMWWCCAGIQRVGKTTVADNISDRVAMAGYGTIVFSVEDGLEIKRAKTLSRITGVPLERVITRRLTENDLWLFDKIGAKVYKAMDRIVLDMTPGPSPLDIVRTVRRNKRKIENLKLVIVDYLQILSRNPKHSERDSLREAMLTFQHAAKAGWNGISGSLTAQQGPPTGQG